MDGLVDEDDAVELLKSKMRESRLRPEAGADKAPAPTPAAKTLRAKAAVAAPAIKIKAEPLSDDDRSSSHASKVKAAVRAVSSTAKPRAQVSAKAGSSASAASSSSTKADSIPPPLIHRKASKPKLTAATIAEDDPGRRISKKKGKRVVRAPVADDQDILEISSDEPEDD